MDKLLKRNLTTIGVSWFAATTLLVVMSWVLGINMLAGGLGISIGYGIALICYLLYYRLTKLPSK